MRSCFQLDTRLLIREPTGYKPVFVQIPEVKQAQQTKPWRTIPGSFQASSSGTSENFL